MKYSVRKMESQISHQFKDIDATREYISKKIPFMEVGYSSYNSEKKIPKMEFDGRPIGEGPTNKATNKLQALNKNHDSFKRKVSNKDIYKYFSNLEEDLVESKHNLEDLFV